MREYPTENIVHILARMAEIKARVVLFKAVDPQLKLLKRGFDEGQITEMRGWLSESAKFLVALEMQSTQKHCEQFARELNAAMDYDVIETKANLIMQDVKFSLEERKLFVINADRQLFYDNPLLAQEKFRDNWPNANEELIEAGNCFSLDRYTACACHLMRAVEYALRAVELALNIPPDKRDTWGPILAKIKEKQGESEHKSKGLANHPSIPQSPEWKANPKFFEDCWHFIGSVKSSCRDEVFHTKASYNDSQAEKLMHSVRSFLETVSENLNEVK